MVANNEDQEAQASAACHHPGNLLADIDYWDYVTLEPNLSPMVFEETTCQGLIKMLENCLSTSKQSILGCSKVLVPPNLTKKIAQDVLKLAATEPCGLRGCILLVSLETEKSCQRLDRIVCDPTVVPTFELTLVFKQDSRPQMSLRSLFCRSPSRGLRQTLVLGNGFRLVKKKLYSLNETTVIEQC